MRTDEIGGAGLRFLTGMGLNRQFLFLRRRNSLHGPAVLCQCAGTSWAMATFWAVGARVLLVLCLAAMLGGPTQGIAEESSDPAPAPAFPKASPDPTSGLGAWIWDAETHPRQTCRFWKSFEITNSAPVVRALLLMTVDNEYTLFLDGRQVGRGSDWRILTEYDLTWVLSRGTHLLAVDAFNSADAVSVGANAAGVILGLRIEFADGSVKEVRSDKSWRVVPETARHWQTMKHAPPGWPKATVVGPVGTHPWWRTPLRIERVPPEQPIFLHFWQTGWFQIMLLSVCGLVVLICLRLMAQVTMQSKAQQLLQLERARIARNIHDDLGAGLTKLVLSGEVAQNELPPDSETRNQIGQLCERARDLSHVVDGVVWAINSRRDTLRDFATYVSSMRRPSSAPLPFAAGWTWNRSCPLWQIGRAHA